VEGLDFNHFVINLLTLATRDTNNFPAN